MALFTDKEREQAKAYLAKSRPPSTPYYTKQKREDTRLANSVISLSIATAIAYGSYKILDTPLTAFRLGLAQKYVPFLGKQIGSPSSFSISGPELLPAIRRVQTPEKTFRYVIDPDINKRLPGLSRREVFGLGEPLEGFKALGTERYAYRGKHYLFEAARRAEESLYQIPRTFQTSALLSSWVFREGTYTIEGNRAAKLQSYLHAIFPEHTATLTRSALLEHGIHYTGGELFLGTDKSTRTRLGKARLVLYETAALGPEETARFHRTQLGEALQKIHGLEPVTSRRTPITFLPVRAEGIGPAVEKALSGDFKAALEELYKVKGVAQIRGMAQNLAQRYVKILDELPSFLEDITGRKFPAIERAWQKFPLKGLLGTGGEYNMSATKLMARHFTYGLPIALGLYGAYKVADSWVRKPPVPLLGPVLDQTILAEGITGAGAEALKKLDINRARLSEALGLTGLRERQEKMLGAPTSLVNLAAIPAAFALFGGMAARIGGGVAVSQGVKKKFSPAAIRKDFDLKEKIFFDLETTGLDTKKDRIVQMSFLRVDQNGKTIGKPLTLTVNPEMPIPDAASRIHRITDADVARAARFRDVASKVEKFIGPDTPLVGYNIRNFDIPVLQRQLSEAGISLDLSKRHLVDLYHHVDFVGEKKTLEAAHQHYVGSALTGAHNAEEDVRGSARIYKAMREQKLAEIARANKDASLTVASRARNTTQLWKQSNVVEELASREGWLGRYGRGLAERGIRITPGKAGALAGALIGSLLVLPLLPGALGASKRTDELEKEYAGIKEVVIRKGRGWEFGRAGWEGSRGSALVPNWYQRLITRATEKQLYPEEDQDRPIKRFIKRLIDPYHYEKLHYLDRPYPTTSASGAVSQLWAMTIGRILKPPKYMHGRELLGGEGGDGQLVAATRRAEEAIAPGGKLQEEALPQFSLKNRGYEFGERWLKSKPGLITYALSSIKDRLTGSSSYFDEYSYLEDFSSVTNGPGRTFWENELGGGFGATEAYRRVFLPRRFAIEYRNPLKNQMPTFLPGPGEKGKDFTTGDPYSSVNLGELRLPGAGFTARYPELKGIPIDEWPATYKYKILADVAPFSSQFQLERMRAQTLYNSGTMSPKEEVMYTETERMLPERKSFQEFAEAEPDSVLGKYWLGLKKVARRLPSEYLTPISPAHKFAGRVDALEQYKENMLAPEFTPWAEPISSFIMPTLRMTAESIPFVDLPPPKEVKKARDIQRQFDAYTFLKYSNLSNIAESVGDRALMSEYAGLARETAAGADPYGPYGPLFRAFPGEERSFIHDFSVETSPARRSEILNMVPENLQDIYKALWDRSDIQKAQSQGKLSVLEAKDAIAQARADSGYTSAPITSGQGWPPRGNDIRIRNLENYFEGGPPIPGPDWIGWCIPGHQLLLTAEQAAIETQNVVTGAKIQANQAIDTVATVLRRQVSLEEKLYKIRVAHDTFHTLEATGEHPVLAMKVERCPFNPQHSSVCSPTSTGWRCNYCSKRYFEHYKVEWVPVSKVTTDHFLLVPKMTTTEDCPTIDLWTTIRWPENYILRDGKIRPTSGIIKPMKSEVVIDEAVSWLIGYYLSDGNVWKTGNRIRGVQFTAAIHEIPLLELAKNIIKEKFGLDGIIRERHRESGGCAYLTVASAALAIVIDSWVGRYCNKKRPPSWLSSVPLEVAGSLLDGLLDGDGSKDERQRLALANHDLALLAKRVWESYGCSVSFCKRARRNKKDIFGVQVIHRSLQVLPLDRYIAYRIVSIEVSSHTGEVFDFHVPGTHSYCTPIGLLHNSPQVELDDIKMKVVQNEAIDMHDVGLWETRERELWRKPYLDNATDALSKGVIDKVAMRRRLSRMLDESGVENYDIFIDDAPGAAQNRVLMDLQHDRRSDVATHLADLGIIRY